VTGPRDVHLTGWVGEHPADGSDVAHLLLYPGAPGIMEGMELLAETLGLVRSDSPQMVSVDPSAAMVTISQHPPVTHLMVGDQEVTRPVSEEWVAAAAAHGLVVLSLGVDPLSAVSIEALDAYTERRDRVWVGLVPVGDRPGPPSGPARRHADFPPGGIPGGL
jgi:hypothetical protein